MGLQGQHAPGGTGSLMLVEPGEFHATRRILGPAGRFAVVTITAEAMAALAGDLAPASGGPHLARAHATDPDLFALFTALHHSLESQATTLESQATTLERQSQLAECVRRLLERHGEGRAAPAPRGRPPRRRPRPRPPPRQPRQRRRPRRTRNRRRRQPPLPLPPVHGLDGAPPHAYQVQGRLAKARAAIASGTPPARVAAETGFHDRSHLGRRLKAAVGVTPGQYARMTGARP